MIQFLQNNYKDEIYIWLCRIINDFVKLFIMYKFKHWWPLARLFMMLLNEKPYS